MNHKDVNPVTSLPSLRVSSDSVLPLVVAVVVAVLQYDEYSHDVGDRYSDDE